MNQRGGCVDAREPRPISRIGQAGVIDRYQISGTKRYLTREA